MALWLAQQLVLALAKRRQLVVDLKVLVLGLSFKENCPDLRNTKVAVPSPLCRITVLWLM